MTDSIVRAVKDDLNSRAARGLAKYGTDMDRTDLTRKDWMVHAYEEALDHALYLRKLIEMEGEAVGTTSAPAKRFGCHVDRNLGIVGGKVYDDCVIDKGEADECTFSTCGDKVRCRHWGAVAK